MNFNAKNATVSTNSNTLSFPTTISTLNIGNEVEVLPEYLVYGCSGLTSITIPNSVSSIGSSVFNGCSGLTSVTIPNSVSSIGSSAFYGCSKLTTLNFNARNATVSTSTGSLSFPTTITTLNIGNEVEVVPGYLAYGCSGLTSITIPSSVTSIGSNAFNGCSALTSVTIPNSVTNIEYYAFSRCSSLSSVTIPNSVTSIGDYAYYNCSGLTSVTIPNSVSSIGNSAFYGCSKLTTLNYYAKNATVSTNSNTLSFPTTISTLNIGNEVEALPGYLAYGCSGLTSVTIPSSVSSIGSSAFNGCSGLTSITIPNSVTSIGSNAFNGCSGLTSITIPSSVTSIGSNAFNGCSALTSVTIPSSATSISSSAFYGCSGLTSVTIPSSVNSIGSSAFTACSKLTTLNYNARNATVSTNSRSLSFPTTITNLIIGNEVEVLPKNLVYNCYGLESVTIPNSVTSIGSNAFTGCSNVNNVVINIKDEDDYIQYLSRDDIKSIFHTSNLSGKKHLICVDGMIQTATKIPNAATRIGAYAFFECSILTSITIPNSVTSIGELAFDGCSSLTSITIPNSVTNIGTSAFYNCSALTLMEFEGARPGEYNLDDIKYIVVPTEYYSDYLAAISKYSKTHLFPKSDLCFTQAPTLQEFEAAIAAIDKSKATAVSFAYDDVDDNLDEEIIKNGMNPNCLYFVPADCSIEGDNIVHVGDASAMDIEKIRLTDDYPFYAPCNLDVSVAEYVHNPSVWATGRSGWETLCLPFEPTTIKASTSGYLSPIVLGGNGNFWLRRYVGSSSNSVFFTSTPDGIMEANTPYLVAFPGESMGAGHLQGQTITFSASNVTLPKTEAPEPIRKNAFVFKGSYDTTADTQAGYELNASGSAFEQTATPGTHPFRAYFTNDELASGGSIKSLKIDFGTFNEETGIFTPEEENPLTEGLQGAYDLSGRRVNESKPMQKGIYIINGKKTVKL